MTLLSTIAELEIFGVYERGVPGKERVALRPLISLNLGHYALALGLRQVGDFAIPIRDQFLWLGNTMIDPPAWILVYTGIGVPRVSTESNTKEPAHVLYWNRSQTLFGNEDVVPIVYRFDGILIGNKPARLLPLLSAPGGAAAAAQRGVKTSLAGPEK